MLKFIIYKKHGHIKHIKGYSFHEYLARDNGIDYFSEVLETGILQDKRLIIVECRDLKHKQRIKNKLIDVSYNSPLFKARQAETITAYNNRLPYILREGD